MFIRFVFSAALLLFPVVAISQECSPTNQIVGADMRSEFKTLMNKARRLSARADGLQFEISELPADFRAMVPDSQPLPELVEDFVADGDIVWVCDANGEPMPAVDAVRAAFDRFDTALDAYGSALDERQAALATAKEAAAAQASGTAAAAAPEQGAAPGTPTDQDAQPDNADALPPGQAPAPDTAETPAVGDPAPPVSAGAKPLTDPDNANLFRRVISLPTATIRATPDSTAEQSSIPTFSVLYVFDESAANGGDWLRVGSSLREEAHGWVSRADTLDWSSMLVMRFAPKGKRSDVLFFENFTDLSDIVNSFSFAAEAKEIYDGLAAQKERLKTDPNAPEEWDRRLVAKEPASAVTFEEQPYLLPILDWRAELFDGTTETTLLQVAAVPADATEVTETDTRSLTFDLDEAAANDGEFRVGVVFVVDTTVSMRPFIERTYDTIQSFYDSFQQYESASFVSFGLVGFRDDLASVEGLEYVTRNFQPLDPAASPQQVLANMRQMRESATPSAEFKEDVLAGVIDAIDTNDWADFDARLVVLITDASARTGADPRAKYQGSTPESVREKARNNKVAIVPLHLLTPANQRNGDAAVAENQYRTLSQTGDTNFGKYFALDATDASLFQAELKATSDEIARAVFAINAGQVSQRPGDVELEEVPEGEVGRVAAAVVNEIFRAQLESLSKAENGGAPSFLSGWTADRDLLDPNLATLEVSVFLTRNQLSSLDKQLAAILEAFRSGGDDPLAFFENLQNLAAQTATDPDVVRADERAALREILPSFLQNLPYKSEVLRLDRAYWTSLSIASRNEFIEQLDAKRRIYRDIFNQTALWRDFGADDPALQVTPVRLTNLP